MTCLSHNLINKSINYEVIKRKILKFCKQQIGLAGNLLFLGKTLDVDLFYLFQYLVQQELINKRLAGDVVSSCSRLPPLEV